MRYWAWDPNLNITFFSRLTHTAWRSLSHAVSLVYLCLAVTHNMMADVEFFIGDMSVFKKLRDLRKIQTSDLLTRDAKRDLSYSKLWICWQSRLQYRLRFISEFYISKHIEVQYIVFYFFIYFTSFGFWKSHHLLTIWFMWISSSFPLKPEFLLKAHMAPIIPHYLH